LYYDIKIGFQKNVAVTYDSDSKYQGDIIIPSKVDYDGVTYTVNKIGSGAFKDCVDLSSVSIPETVTTIEFNAFNNCTSLTSIYIPDKVYTIGDQAFCNCISLKSIENGSSVQSIGWYSFKNCYSLKSVGGFDSLVTLKSYAFENCYSLESFYVAPSVKSIEDSAFLNCISLEEINVSEENAVYASLDGVLYNKDFTTLLFCPACVENIKIPESVALIYKDAFDECNSLKSVDIPDSVTTIEMGNFVSCNSLETVHLGNNVSEIGFFSFYNCPALISVNLPETLTAIPSQCFQNCDSLESIEIPTSIKTIGYESFMGCSSLRSVIIPPSVINMDSKVFADCSSLEEINVAAENKNYSSIDGVLYNKNQSQLILCPGAKENIDIPQSVTTIKGDAFNGCRFMTDLFIPANISLIGKNAFSYNLSLQEINVADDNPVYASFDGILYDKKFRTLIQCPGARQQLDILPTVIDIDYSAFNNCVNLTSVNIPPSVVSIGDNAFYKCISLTAIDLPVHLSYIGISAFSCCSSLKSVISRCPKAPYLDMGAFFNIAPDASLYVYEDAIDKYKYTYFDLVDFSISWNQFFDTFIPIEDGVPVCYISLSNSENQNLYINETVTFTADVLPSDALNPEIEWSLEDDEGIVSMTVSKEDEYSVEIKALKVGEALLRVSSKSNPMISSSIKISVSNFSHLENLIYQEENTYRVFNINGINVLTTDDVRKIEQLPAGVYIINGRKILVGR
ncbi:MAG: leucine-rich repeat domain-containing protein, partial [Muribaculaceae bacterium]|nr:leucine-rich repeat domain-containing protein [Muribaculaceae bacterium]